MDEIIGGKYRLNDMTSTKVEEGEKEKKKKNKNREGGATIAIAVSIATRMKLGLPSMMTVSHCFRSYSGHSKSPPDQFLDAGAMTL